MRRNDEIYRTEIYAYRSDGMHIFLPTRCVRFASRYQLSSCFFRMCPFYELTCDKCHYSV